MSKKTIVLKSPPRKKTAIRIILALLGVFFSGLFLMNLTAGIIEIPDNLPIVGNLDEVAATAMLLGCLDYLGINLVPFQRKRDR